ncbi:adenosylcobinamide-GDP ribazoletransferase [Ensifer sesbaniae]|uniref:adenosylcobinamide-GDP ribazoletransferase n=1 Tax=Ensifer sesbaniae TaxID=1214071 RepID=UPI002000F508|nr:adenosylcobinamide-GDP ribazoletransferase [Ensifer sesbaniae]
MGFVGDFYDDVARSVGFLSRIPMPGRHFVGYDGRLSRAVRAFPLAGIVIVLPSAAAASAMNALQVSSLFAAFVVIALQTLLTGALHEDGLGDTADGFGGGRDRDAALEIMKDSRVGTYGAVALILSFGLRVSALASILPLFTPLGAGMAILGAAALSRAAMVWHWSSLPPARNGGVAASAGTPDPAAARFALGFGLLAAMLLFYFAKAPALGLIATIVAFLVAVKGFGRVATRKIGGHTGDTIGATQQLTEIAVLGTLALTV